MVAELVEPIQLPIEEAPKRRGRPPKMNPDGTRANPPRVAQPRKPKRPRSAARPSTRKLKEEIAAFLTMVNSVVLMTPLGTKPTMAAFDPNVPVEKIGDELDEYEISALAASIDRQCLRSPRFRKYVERMLGVGSGGTLIATVGIIAARRAARHGVIPNGEAVDFSLGMMLASGGVEAAASAPVRAPVVADERVVISGEVTPDRSNDEGIDYETIGTFAEP